MNFCVSIGKREGAAAAMKRRHNVTPSGIEGRIQIKKTVINRIRTFIEEQMRLSRNGEGGIVAFFIDAIVAEAEVSHPAREISKEAVHGDAADTTPALTG